MIDKFVTPELFPSAGWFAALPPKSIVVFPLDSRWNKRVKTTHRYRVADVNGPIDLTLPIMKPQSLSRCTLADIRISNHGNWWHVHRVTLESGYGRTPYFEHYFPKLEKFFKENTISEFPYLWQFLLASTQALATIIGLDIKFATGLGYGCETTVIPATLPPYHQIRQQKLGFIPGLSILDMLFNKGPETILYLRNFYNKSNHNVSNS